MRKRSKKEKEGGIELKGKNSPESLVEEILKLEPIEFLGICKIIGVDVYEDVECAQANEDENALPPARDFYEIWNDVCDTIGDMNRVRRRNLGKLIYAATKSKKEN